MMMNREIRPTKIILDARRSKPNILLSCAEIDFVSRQPQLNFCEKWIWMLIASSTGFDPKLTCSLSFEEMAERIAGTPEMVEKAILRLHTMGFIQTVGSHDHTRFCKLTYPLEGLLALQAKGSQQPLSISLLNGFPVNRMKKQQEMTANQARILLREITQPDKTENLAPSLDETQGDLPAENKKRKFRTSLLLWILKWSAR